jgi:signal recognition particle GTPase
MFDILTEKLNKIFHALNSRGKLSEKDIDEMLREIRLALLEADVNFKVVRQFLDSVREQAITAKSLKASLPVQQIVKSFMQSSSSAWRRGCSSAACFPQALRIKLGGQQVPARQQGGKAGPSSKQTDI